MSDKNPWVSMSRTEAKANEREIARQMRREKAERPPSPYDRAPLTGNMAGASPFQQNAARLSDVLWRRDRGEQVSPEELQALQAWQLKQSGG